MTSDMPGPGKTVLARLVTRILDFAEKAGLDRRALVAGAGLEGIDLTQPDARVPYTAQVGLWQAIESQTTDPAFGLRLGASVRTRELGLLGYAMYLSGTLRGALRRLVRYGGLLSEAVRFRFERPGAEHVLVAEYPLALGPRLRNAIDARVAGLIGVAREITRVNLTPTSVTLAYDRPDRTLDHDAFFRCPLSFGARMTTVSLRPQDLELPVPGGDEQAAGYLSEHAETVLRTLKRSATTTERVRSAVWAALGEGRPTVAGAASALRVSPRTLQRQLSDEGTSFKAELEHVRSQMAAALLRDRTIPIDEVSFLLGYAEPSSFYRSFRRWTGATPEAFRRAAS